MAFYQLYKEQVLQTSVEEAWNFISSPKNLKKITPDYMGFDIISNNLPEKMYPGMIIEYKVSPVFNIKTQWVTEITQVKEHSFFIDEQRIGPYKLWHHQHILEPQHNGTLMKDIISYQPPFGFMGALANTLFIRKQLEEIFEYRFKSLDMLFHKKAHPFKQ